MKPIKLRRGYRVRLTGDVLPGDLTLITPRQIALKPIDFTGLTARPVVAVGDPVKVGTPLFVHKKNEKIRVTSTVSGTVMAIVRGERRILQRIVVESDGKMDAAPLNVSAVSSDAVIETLLESGLFACFVQRPFAVIADPEKRPRDIFISAVDTAPLAALTGVILKGNEDAFQTGIDILKKISAGKVHLAIPKNADAALTRVQNAELHVFSGKHPAGNVGVQIHHISPVRNINDIVWTISVQHVILIGRLFRDKKLNHEIVVKAAGSAAPNKGYYKTVLGAQVAPIIGTVNDAESRVISGSVLTGRQTGAAGFIGFFDNLISIIPEIQKPKFINWLMPGFSFESKSRTFLSNFIYPQALLPNKTFVKDTNMHGGRRAFVFTGIYRNVLPMDIYPVHLMKAILAEDIELMEGLGIYEMAPEDVALCEYICPSKIEFQEILQNGLDLIMREA